VHFTYEIFIGVIIMNGSMTIYVSSPVTFNAVGEHPELPPPPLPFTHIISSYLLHTMPRCRDVIVPNAVKGIEEVVVTHTKTKRGTIRTKEKIVPVVLPMQERPGQTSKSKKNSPPQLNSSDTHVPEKVIPTAHPAEDNPYLDDQEYLLPDPTTEESQQRATVRPDQHIIIDMLIFCRLRWSNGQSSGTRIFIYY
jgi:hypothetical protein